MKLMTGKQSTDISPIENVREQLLERFGAYNFSSRNILLPKEALEVWHGVPQDTACRSVPNSASALLRRHTVKSRAALC